jgi:hypothetical protein
MVEEGEKVIRTVDERYRRSGLYWDHQEFGGHYYRPMSAWSVLHAYLGLGIADGAYRFSPKLQMPEYTLFFAHGNGTAHYRRTESGIGLEVRSGNMLLSSLEIADQGFNSGIAGFTLNGKPVKARIKTSPGILSVSLPERITLIAGDRIEIGF